MTRRRAFFNILLGLFLAGLAQSCAAGRYSLFVVRSGSMAPALPVYAVIVVDKAAGDIAPGDIITFRSPQGDRLITHRVIAAGFDGTSYYITRGDANSRPDPHPVRAGEVVGRVVYATPAWLAAPVRFLRAGAALPLFLPLLLVALAGLFANRRFLC